MSRVYHPGAAKTAVAVLSASHFIAAADELEDPARLGLEREVADFVALRGHIRMVDPLDEPLRVDRQDPLDR